MCRGWYSAAIRCGLIEAAGIRSALYSAETCIPQRFAAASLKQQSPCRHHVAPSCIPQRFAAASLLLKFGLRCDDARAQYSAAIRCGLIEATPIFPLGASSLSYSAAIRCGLIEARLAVHESNMPASAYSAAIRCGLIEAMGLTASVASSFMGIPQRFAAASLKPALPARRPSSHPCGIPQRFAAASLKPSVPPLHLLTLPTYSAAIRCGLIEAS